MRWLFAAVAFVVGSVTWGQEIRERGSLSSSSLRARDSAAEDQGIYHWPRVRDGEDGTQVSISSDFRNADIVLITAKEFSIPKLLLAATNLASRLGCPKADFITYEGKRVSYVDIELNDYLQKDGSRTTWEVDLGLLADALKAQGLPLPIVLCIDGEEAEEVMLTGLQPSGHDLQFFTANEIHPGAVVKFTTVLHWYAYPAAVGLVLLLLTLISLPIRIAMKAKRLVPPAGPRTPSEVQAEYDKERPAWLIGYSWILLVPIFLLLPIGKKIILQGLFVLPPLPDDLRLIFLIVLVPMVLSGLTLMWVFKKRKAEILAQPAEPDPDAEPDVSGSFRWLFLPFLLLVIFMIFGRNLLGGLSSEWRLLIIFGTIAIFVAIAFLDLRRTSQSGRQELKPGDEWHDFIMAVGARAGIQPKRIVTIRTPVVNAFVTPMGTVGCTTALLRKCTKEEVAAIIAHEIGHLKAGHAKRNLVVSLVGTAVLLGLWLWLTPYLRPYVSREFYRLLNGPFFAFFGLPLLAALVFGPGRRKRELEADRFAVELIGDPEAYIRALTKLHDLNESPHRLKRSDEALATHPSLASRIAAIRALRPNQATASGSQGSHESDS